MANESKWNWAYTTAMLALLLSRRHEMIADIHQLSEWGGGLKRAQLAEFWFICHRFFAGPDTSRPKWDAIFIRSVAVNQIWRDRH